MNLLPDKPYTLTNAMAELNSSLGKQLDASLRTTYTLDAECGSQLFGDMASWTEVL
jgi:hypothetical protein